MRKKLFNSNYFSESLNFKGYSPVFNFEVEDFIKTKEKIISYGGIQDGEIV